MILKTGISTIVVISMILTSLSVPDVNENEPNLFPEDITEMDRDVLEIPLRSDFERSVSMGSILHVGGTGGDNYTTITAAVLDSADGDTIIVHDDSTYVEEVNVDRSITIKGEGMPEIATTGAMVFNLMADNVTLIGMNITDALVGVIGDGSGYTIEDCIFWYCWDSIKIGGNMINVAKDHAIYDIEIRGCRFHHNGNGDAVEIGYNTDFDSGSHNLRMEDILVEENVFYLNGSTVIAVNMKSTGINFADLTGGYLDIGKIEVKDNVLYGGQVGVAFGGGVGSVTDVQVEIDDLIVSGNRMYNQLGSAVFLDSWSGSIWGGNSVGDYETMIIRDNVIVSNTGSDGVEVSGLGDWRNLFGSSSLTVGGIHILNNNITVSRIGVVMYNLGVGSDLYDRSSFEMIDFLVEGNTITSYSKGIFISNRRFGADLHGESECTIGKMKVSNNHIDFASNGIELVSYYMGYNLFGNAAMSCDEIQINRNTISGIYGIRIEYKYAGSYLQNNATADIGLFVIRGNEIESDSGIILDGISNLAYSLQTNSTSSVMGFSIIENDIIAWVWGIQIDQYSSNANYISGSSNGSVGGLKVINNTIGNSNAGVFVNLYEDMCEFIGGTSFSSIGGLMIDGNTIETVDMGVYLNQFRSIGRYLAEDAVVDVGGISVSENYVASSDDQGILLNSIREIGTDFGTNSTASFGTVNISANVVDSYSYGIVIEEYRDIGNSLYTSSTMDIGGIMINDNQIDVESVTYGISLYTLRFIGNGLYGWSNVTMGNVEVCRNIVTTPDTAVDMSNFYYLGHGLFDQSSFIMGDILLNDNVLKGGDHGIYSLDFEYSARDLNAKSRFLMGNIQAVRNDITCQSTGISMSFGGSFFDLDQDASGVCGMISVSDNTIRDGTLGIYLHLNNIGDSNIGSSMVNISGADISWNRILTDEGIEFFIDGMTVYQSSSIIFGDQIISDNYIENCLGDGIRSRRMLKTYESSTIDIGRLIIDQNGLFNCTESGLNFTESISETPGSTLLSGEMLVKSNIISGNNRGLDVENVILGYIYLNDFIGNTEHLHLSMSEIYLNSSREMLYRYMDEIHQSRLGNYWDNYTGSDNDGNGIGDEVFPLYSNVDNFPLVSGTNEYVIPEDDSTPPNITIVSPADGDFIPRNWVLVKWSGKDEGIGIEYYQIKIDGTLWIDVGVTNSYNITSLAEGSHTIWVSAWDYAGNSNMTNISIFVDLANPVVVIYSPVDDEIFDSTVDISFEWGASDSGSGLGFVRISLDGGASINAGTSTSYDFGEISEGQHVFRVVAYDRSGRSSLASVRFVVDVSPPELIIIYPSSHLYNNTGTVNIRWMVTDLFTDISEVTYSLDSINYTSAGSVNNLTLANLTEGEHSIRIRAEDEAGNVNISRRIRITVDMTDPVIELSVPVQGGYYNTANLTVNWTADGTGSPVRDIRLKLDGGGTQELGAVLSYTLYNLTEGSHTLEVEIEDRSGNTAVKTVDFIVDVTPPSILDHTPEEDGLAKVDTLIVVEFSEEIDLGSFIININLNVEGSVSWSGNTMTFTPSRNLSLNTGYTVLIRAEDLAGNRIDYNWQFSTFSPVTGLGSVTGRVLDTNGDPIANARIRLDTGEETTTDPNGRFSLIGPVGEHEMRISASGYKDRRITVTILEGKQVEIDDIELSDDTTADPVMYILILLIIGILVIVIIAVSLFVFGRRSREEEAVWDEE
ncbi:MAG: carboxypeptidase regulatory-like domain-containing protein [Thermoplasmatota archaeon]